MSTPLEWHDLWEVMADTPSQWVETTEAMYWQMLECVPPRAMASGRFLVGEPKTHVNGIAIHACFWDCGNGQYFARYMTVAEFRHATDPITQYFTDRANGAHAAKAP